MLYDFCGEFGVEYRRTGKLIVATGDDQREQLAALHGKALANGVDDLELLGPEAVVEMEPELRCAAALHSPSTGIVDSHGLMVALQGDAEAHGAWVVVDSPVTGGGVNRDGTFRVVTADMELSCTELINCTGLSAPAVALSIGTPADHVPVPYFAKGNYYRLEGRSPFKRLIYPVPESAGLGVHATIDLGGQVRFGPDVEWVDGAEEENYTVDPARAGSFYREVRRYWPALPDASLVPDYAGIRPKLQRPGEPSRDFLLQGPKEHGIAGLINLFGIESPGLTSSLALAKLTHEMLK